MRLICIARYNSSLGSFGVGQVVDGKQELLKELLRDSPGSFRIDGSVLVAPDLSAISEELPTGIVAPDRRMRGGRRRA